ncbi:MAG: hypothetical protein CVU42_01650 [Chloroflexi bacterium HGW-Chloroflexi-4]|jgi:pilus assembly protein CpaE|nr:MAG: hypothetical protein CVU42_01650 [Chloroflexi bacterium HGW-Chloroflexi-4]
MTTSSENTKLLVVTKNKSLKTNIDDCIFNQKGLDPLNSSMLQDNILDFIAENSPDLVLLDFEYQENIFEVVDRIVTDYPECGVIVILPESEMLNSEKVILSGARAFILQPFKKENLVKTINRVVELMKRGQANANLAPTNPLERPKNTFTVFSPKGGAGTTTVAVNLAISLHKELQEEVLLIDGKHLFGHVALCLNLRTANSITDLISHIGVLDQRMVKQVVVKHISGISVLPSPTLISEGQGIRPDDIYKMLEILQGIYPNIIIDAGSHLTDNTVTYMDLSDKILLVLNPDLASLRDVRQFEEVSHTLNYPDDKTMLILNLTGRKADVKREEIEKILKMNIFGKIPADENLALSCLNEGVPIVLKNPRHQISAAFSVISKGLVKIIQSARTTYNQSSNKDKSALLSRSSNLG